MPAELGGGETGCWGGMRWQEPPGWNENFVEKDWEGQLKARIEELRREHAPKVSRWLAFERRGDVLTHDFCSRTRYKNSRLLPRQLMINATPVGLKVRPISSRRSAFG